MENYVTEMKLNNISNLFFTRNKVLRVLVKDVYKNWNQYVGQHFYFLFLFTEVSAWTLFLKWVQKIH